MSRLTALPILTIPRVVDTTHGSITAEGGTKNERSPSKVSSLEKKETVVAIQTIPPPMNPITIKK